MKQICAALFLCLLFACGNDDDVDQPSKIFAKDKPHDLNYENVSVLLQDMKNFSDAVRVLKQERVQRIDERYDDVLFQFQEDPLFLNVYQDPAGNEIVFLLVPKDPETGANYLLSYDQKLPVTDAETVEIQIRTRNPEQPFQCRLSVTDPTAYMKERSAHDYVVTYVLEKQFVQGGTYDFDALTVPSYRTRGYPFIVFDLVKAVLTDQTANLSTDCK